MLGDGSDDDREDIPWVWLEAKSIDGWLGDGIGVGSEMMLLDLFDIDKQFWRLVQLVDKLLGIAIEYVGEVTWIVAGLAISCQSKKPLLTTKVSRSCPGLGSLLAGRKGLVVLTRGTDQRPTDI